LEHVDLDAGKLNDVVLVGSVVADAGLVVKVAWRRTLVERLEQGKDERVAGVAVDVLNVVIVEPGPSLPIPLVRIVQRQGEELGVDFLLQIAAADAPVDPFAHGGWVVVLLIEAQETPIPGERVRAGINLELGVTASVGNSLGAVGAVGGAEVIVP